MADTTLSAIMTRIEAAVEALSFKATREPFSHDRQPNTVLDDSYRVEDGGLISQRSMTNYAAARIDRVTVWVAKKLAFANQSSVHTVEETLNDIERAIIEDGDGHDYHVQLVGRRVTRAPEKDWIVASLDLSVDFDYLEIV